MAIVEYTPELFEKLQEMVARVPRNMNLAYRPFVDYYYASRSWCKLYVYLSDSGRVVGTIGCDLMRFEQDSREIAVRLSSNWFSLQPGVGGKLTRFSAQANPNSFGMLLMASRAALTVVGHQGWVPIAGLTGYFLNGCSLHPWNAWWKSAANLLVQGCVGKKLSRFASRIPPEVKARITVREEHSYSPDMLPRRSPFSFRFAPTVEHLEWRYNLSLSFVRYRLFRILAGGASVGYVILNESGEQIMVAQCDGEDAAVLAYGVLLAILQAGAHDQRPRLVFLSCCHAEMQAIYERFGFMRRLGGEIPFGFRNLPPGLDASKISSWLVNYDWSDNGLQAPFPDQAAG